MTESVFLNYPSSGYLIKAVSTVHGFIHSMSPWALRLTSENISIGRGTIFNLGCTFQDWAPRAKSAVKSWQNKYLKEVEA